ncbi:MAG: hypothetical protein ACE5JQ_04670, partial [Candidatus Methylomirabilales bacterium]
MRVKRDEERDNPELGGGKMRPFCSRLLVLTMLALCLFPREWAAADGPGTAVKQEREPRISPANLFGSGKQEIALAAGYAIP